MLRSIDELEKSFRALSEKSKKECGSEIEKIRELTIVSGIFLSSVYTFLKENKEKSELWGRCLYHVCLFELIRTSAYILFLSINGLYRNAYDCIRHTIESVIQAIYIDDRHSNISLKSKIEILKEVEDKTDYHAVRLINELKIGHKDELKAEYKVLSKMIHPSHKQIITTIRDIKTDEEGVPTHIDCKEISNIYESMRRMYDIFFFIILNYYPEFREALKKDRKFTETIRLYKLRLVSNIISIKL